MKDYYFLDGKEHKGPFSFEQLVLLRLNRETLIWVEGMENWEKIKDISEFQIFFKPPPPPIEIIEELSVKLNDNSQQSYSHKNDTNNSNSKMLKLYIIWCSFHFFALLMSYSQIKIFNNLGRHWLSSGIPRTEEFWPFVNFNGCSEDLEYEITCLKGGYWFKECFDGFFVDYDWSEFAFYVGSATIIFILLKIKKK